jgi:hypothetical protein
MRVYTHRCVSPTLPDDRRPGWMPARAGLASSTIVFKRSRTSAPRFQPSQSSGTSACGMTSRSLVSISTNSRAMSSPTAESAGAISCQRCCRSVRPFAEQYATRLSSRWANCFVSVTSTQFGSSRATSALAYRSSWSWPNSESSFDSTRTYSWRCAEASPRRPSQTSACSLFSKRSFVRPASGDGSAAPSPARAADSLPTPRRPTKRRSTRMQRRSVRRVDG